MMSDLPNFNFHLYLISLHVSNLASYTRPHKLCSFNYLHYITFLQNTVNIVFSMNMRFQSVDENQAHCPDDEKRSERPISGKLKTVLESIKYKSGIVELCIVRLSVKYFVLYACYFRFCVFKHF